MRFSIAALLAAYVLFISPCLVLAGQAAEPEPGPASEQRQFTFAWPFMPDDAMRPRGGLTRGGAVKLLLQPSEAWLSLQRPDLSDFERDRRAILAMAGPYRTTFDFVETAGFTDGYVADPPYQSWATETIYVIEDRGDFISLQHILVMVFAQDDGELSEPMVVKHWRQDWRYQDRDLHVYRGNRRWQRVRLAKEAVAGAWTQAVFQVDDSPRYESSGRWVHHPGYSAWQSADTWRPLPRREFSVRDDYQVLAGTNRHAITPTGWVQEEDNLKLVVDDDQAMRIEKVVAREVGLNRYQRIGGHDFSAGDEYWRRTGRFWQDVRAAWQSIYREQDEIRLRASVEGRPLYAVMFEYADRLESSETYDAVAGRRYIVETLQSFQAP